MHRFSQVQEPGCHGPDKSQGRDLNPASEKWIWIIETVKSWLGWAFCIRNTAEDEILYKMDNVEILICKLMKNLKN